MVQTTTSTKIIQENKNPKTEIKKIATENNTVKNLTEYILKLNDNEYKISLAPSSSVLDLMNALQIRGDIKFQGHESAGLGFFVESINGLKNFTDHTSYWIYYINGKSASVGISNYILKPGDIITWKYEKPIF